MNLIQVPNVNIEAICIHWFNNSNGRKVVFDSLGLSLTPPKLPCQTWRFGCQTSLSFKASPAKGHNDMKPEISQKWQCKNTTCFGVFEMLFFNSKWVGYVFLTASCSASNYWNTLQHGCYLLLTSRGWYRPFLLFSWSSLSVFIQSADETPAHLASQNSKTSLDGQKALRIHGQTQNRIQKSNCKTA